MTEFYSCRALLEPDTVAIRDYRITKFDADLNFLSSYETSAHGCQCPQGHKPNCRHREMLVLFKTSGHIDDGWLLDWHTRLWWEPAASGDVGAAVAELQSAQVIGPGTEVIPGVMAYGFAERTLPAAPQLPHVTNPVQPVSDTAARPPEVAASIPAPSGGSSPGFKRRFG